MKQQGLVGPRAVGPAATSSPGKWRVRQEVSPIDDSKNVFLELDANSSVTGWMHTETPTLEIRCKERKTEAYIVVGMPAHIDDVGYGTTYSYGTFRIDGAKAFQIRMGESTDRTALFFPSGVAFAKRLFGGHKLLFQFTPFNASPVLTTFDVGGIEQAMKPLREACKW